MSRELKIGLGALLLAGTLIYVSSLLGELPRSARSPEQGGSRRCPPPAFVVNATRCA